MDKDIFMLSVNALIITLAKTELLENASNLKKRRGRKERKGGRRRKRRVITGMKEEDVFTCLAEESLHSCLVWYLNTKIRFL